VASWRAGDEEGPVQPASAGSSSGRGAASLRGTAEHDGGYAVALL